MSQSGPYSPTLFLREEALRHGSELILRADRALSELAAPVLEETGISRAEYRVLMLLAQAPGIGPSELQGRLRIRKQSLQGVLRDMTDRGLVTTAPDSRDRRRRRLDLTPDGQALERRLFAAMRTRLSAAYLDAGPEAVAGFWTVLEKIIGDD